jgi:hypothetical protein
MSEAKDILSLIRARQQASEKTPDMNPKGSPTTEDWKRFKEHMIESVDGEPLKKSTGKTNKEFFKYIKEDIDDDECKIGDRTDDQKRLREFLKNLDK